MPSRFWRTDIAEWLYFAYGSNINLEQMAVRCLTTQVIGPAVLDGYELLFRGNRRGTSVATIEPSPDSQVHDLLWKLTPGYERSLDVYEGYPRLYERKNITVRIGDGKDVIVVAYIVTGGLWRDPTIPSPAYYDGILEGYRQSGLPVPELEAALKNVHDEIRQARHFKHMQEMDLFFGGKPGREKGHHER